MPIEKEARASCFQGGKGGGEGDEVGLEDAETVGRKGGGVRGGKEMVGGGGDEREGADNVVCGYASAVAIVDCGASGGV